AAFAHLQTFARSVLQRNAGDIVALEMVARGLGAVAVEAGKARAIELLRALHDFLGERVGMAEHLLADVRRGAQSRLRLRLVGERADLDRPFAPGVVRGRRWRGR